MDFTCRFRGAYSLNRWRWLTALEENDSIARRRRFRICCFSSMIRVRRLWLLYFWLLRVVLPLLWRPPRRNADHPSSAGRLPGDRRAASCRLAEVFFILVGCSRSWQWKGRPIIHGFQLTPFIGRLFTSLTSFAQVPSHSLRPPCSPTTHLYRLLMISVCLVQSVSLQASNFFSFKKKWFNFYKKKDNWMRLNLAADESFGCRQMT